MSSTNHTANYNLPQFVGSDKPAWLGDINPAMSAIDTAMHANAAAAAQASTDAGNAQAAAAQASTDAGNAATAAQTAQGTANTAISEISTANAKIDAINEKIQLTQFSNSAISPTGLAGSFNVTLAQNDEGSLFKLYGTYAIANRTNSTISPFSSYQKTITFNGSNHTVIDLGLQLNSAPSNAFAINPAGFAVTGSYSSNVLTNYLTPSLIIDTDGKLYLEYYNQNSVSAQSYHFVNLYPALYFNTNFGDLPTPTNA